MAATDGRTQSGTVREIIAAEIRCLFVVSRRRKRRIIVNAKVGRGACDSPSATAAAAAAAAARLARVVRSSMDGQQ